VSSHPTSSCDAFPYGYFRRCFSHTSPQCDAFPYGYFYPNSSGIVWKNDENKLNISIFGEFFKTFCSDDEELKFASCADVAKRREYLRNWEDKNDTLYFNSNDVNRDSLISDVKLEVREAQTNLQFAMKYWAVPDWQRPCYMRSRSGWWSSGCWENHIGRLCVFSVFLFPCWFCIIFGFYVWFTWECTWFEHDNYISWGEKYTAKFVMIPVLVLVFLEATVGTEYYQEFMMCIGLLCLQGRLSEHNSGGIIRRLSGGRT
jgi:hypothetical protein